MATRGIVCWEVGSVCAWVRLWLGMGASRSSRIRRNAVSPTTTTTRVTTRQAKGQYSNPLLEGCTEWSKRIAGVILVIWLFWDCWFAHWGLLDGIVCCFPMRLWLRPVRASPRVKPIGSPTSDVASQTTDVFEIILPPGANSICFVA